MIQRIKNFVNSNIKNFPGFKTRRKIVIFSVDDYGNIRVGSPQARQNMIQSGLYGNWSSRFDYFDSLETANDLSILFETLSSVKDITGRFAVFTPFANCVNIDFQGIRDNGFDHYRFKKLPEVLNSSPNHQGAWDLWKEGIENRLFVPQFHGREHLNINLFNRLLLKRDYRTLVCLNNDSYTNIEFSHSPSIKYGEAFSFESFNENEALEQSIKDGLNLFEEIFGYRARNFNAPGAPEHSVLEKTLLESGIKYIDSGAIKKEHQGDGKYKNKFRYMGMTNPLGQIYLLRNCVFEPTLIDPDEAINKCLIEIETAFRWNKPANISSHRVNFCGLIDPKNRKRGITALNKLLKKLVLKWPEVEFFTSEELGQLIKSSKND